MAASLGKKIKMLRTEKGLTQAELGELLNKSGSTVRMWELDRSQPSPQTIRSRHYSQCSTWQGRKRRACRNGYD